MTKFESFRCQTCGAYIGWVGRFFQRFIGCFLVRSGECVKFDCAPQRRRVP